MDIYDVLLISIFLYLLSQNIVDAQQKLVE